VIWNPRFVDWARTLADHSFVSSVLSARLSRFILVGALNTAIGYAIYALFIYVGLPFPVANFLAVVVGIVIGFKTQATLVFQNPDNRLFVRFVTLWVVMYVLTTAIIAQFISLGMNAYAAGAAMLPISATISFIVQKTWVFRRRGRTNSSQSPQENISTRDSASGSGE
jgi:putative flippase GtrA